ncbi:hypothetical protein ACLOJK_039709 [Asimina triloba]
MTREGKLPEGQEIAVKRLSRSSGQGPEEFKNEAWELWKEGRSVEIIDPILLDDLSPTSTTEIPKYVQVALLCVQDRSMDRPTMSDVVHMLTDKTAAMAEPKHPAFFIRRASKAESSSSTPTPCSVNDVTASEIEGR